MKVRVIYYRLHKKPNFSEFNVETKLDKKLLDSNIFHEKELDGDVVIYKIPFVEVGPRIGFFTNECKVLQRFKTADSLDKVEFSKKTMMKAAEYKHLVPDEEIEYFISVDEFFDAYAGNFEQKLELDFDDHDFNAVKMFSGTACSDRAKDTITYLINDLKRENIMHEFKVNSNGDYEFKIPYLTDEDYDGQILMFTANEQVDISTFSLDVENIAIARMLGTILEPSVDTVDMFELCFAYC